MNGSPLKTVRVVWEVTFDRLFASIITTVVFKRGDERDLRDYVLFKKDAIASDVDSGLLEEKLLQELGRKGILRLNKNDAIFIARP